MTAKDVIRKLFNSSDTILTTYLNDLSDADPLLRPVPGSNHIAWQLGHLINSEQSLLKYIPGTTPIELPSGWAEKYSADSSRAESTTGFLSKADYLTLYQKSRANAVKNLDQYPESDLDKPTTGRLASIAPTHGQMFVLIANHPLMHVGQFVVVRRKLGKPIVI